MTHERPHSRATGKWADPNVPKRGWLFSHMDDLGYPAETCEMCETADIRYVHYMIHPQYPDELGCGCICAGHMEEASGAAREREDTFKRRERRVRIWGDREWKTSGKGNTYLKISGYVATLFYRNDRWAASILDTRSHKTEFSRRRYDSYRAAQQQTLKYLSRLVDERKKSDKDARQKGYVRLEDGTWWKPRG